MNEKYYKITMEEMNKINVLMDNIEVKGRNNIMLFAQASQILQQLEQVQEIEVKEEGE